MQVLEHVFLENFGSQKNAEFPSPEFQGPFSGLAVKVMHEQWLKLSRLLGKDWFENHQNPLVRSSQGFL
jgi:glucosamine-6-phosphate deaminase